MRFNINVTKSQGDPELAFYKVPHQGIEYVMTGSAFEAYVLSLSAINSNNISLHFPVLSLSMSGRIGMPFPGTHLFELEAYRSFRSFPKIGVLTYGCTEVSNGTQPPHCIQIAEMRRPVELMRLLLNILLHTPRY